MIRVRNPHQLMVLLLRDGQTAVFHYEPTVGLEGWSRMVMGAGSFVDATVMVDKSGLDVPLFLVQRQINGQKRLYLESMPTWSQSVNYLYSDSWVFYDNTTGTNVFTGLDHLEGSTVAVTGDAAFIGWFTVTNGAVTLVNGEGQPIIAKNVGIGLDKWAFIRTLPPAVDIKATGGPGGFKRYSSISLRLRYSVPPLVNGIRPPDKNSDTTMDSGEPLVPLQDVDVTNFGFSIYEPIEIAEVLPVRSEIVGIYGKLTSNRV
jgi:hypothetical protein